MKNNNSKKIFVVIISITIGLAVLLFLFAKTLVHTYVEYEDVDGGCWTKCLGIEKSYLCGVTQDYNDIQPWCRNICFGIYSDNGSPDCESKSLF